MNDQTYHQPVLLKESVDGLVTDPDGIYVDVTFGGGGHSSEILKRLRNGRLIAFDQDPEACKNAQGDSRLTMVNANFRYLLNFLRYHDAFPVNGILADLGVSSHQIDTPERGFSTRFDGPLDLRMNPASEKTASFIVNNYPESELKQIFREYGGLLEASRIASRIANQRASSPIETTTELKEIIKTLCPRESENKFMAKVFQALRIEVNEETTVLNELLLQSKDALCSGGRLVVIAYHSSEDKPVKNFMRSGNLEGEIEKDFYGNILTPFRQITRKAVEASEDEIAANKRARSARLRIAEKI
ncbi:MAG: 16S rRNA (cytosine(1402)-N(4))-methyltransferase RsmH [Bacteroidota bacterium]